LRHSVYIVVVVVVAAAAVYDFYTINIFDKAAKVVSRVQTRVDYEV